VITFRVDGDPLPQGSHTVLRIGRQFALRDQQDMARRDKDGNQTRPSGMLTKWREAIGEAAANALGGLRPLDGPVHLRVRFEFSRPASHTGKRGLTKAGRSAPFPTSRRDLSKLVRAVEDALTGVAIRDDADIVNITAFKRWAHDRPGVDVEVWTVHEGGRDAS